MTILNPKGKRKKCKTIFSEAANGHYDGEF